MQDKVEVALIISVQTILDGTPTADQQKYAAHVFSNIRSEGKKALASVLAVNNAATVVQILGANDTQIRTNVGAVVDTLSVAYNAGLSASVPV